MSHIQLRPLQVADASAVVRLVRSSFDPELLPFMIYGQRGVDAFIVDSLPRSGVARVREFVIAVDESDGDILGFADFDLRSELDPHLAYLCVAPKARGRGIASQLIEHFCRMHSDAPSLTLNVFKQNEAARRLYKKLNFVEGQWTTWHVRELPVSERYVDVRIEDLPNMIAAHQRFGFAATTLESGSRTHRIGLLGDDVVRVSEPDAFANDHLLAAFGRAFPTAQTALLVSGSGLPGALSTVPRHVLTAVHMRLVLSTETRSE